MTERKLAGFEILGLDECDAALGALPRALAAATVRRVLRKAAAPIREAIIRMAPEDQGDLKKSIRIVNVKAKDLGRRAYQKIRINGGSRAAASVGLVTARRESKSFGEVATFSAVDVRIFAHHAWFNEFGTERQAAKPFIIPAWEATKTQALDAIRSTLWAEIQKTAARAAARAAKAAR